MREHRNSIPEARSRPAAGHLTAAVRPSPRRHITLAEHERAAISERTKAARRQACGVKLGGPRLPAARKASIKVRSESGVSSLRGVVRALTARGIRSPRGRDWSDVQVAAILRRRPQKSPS